MHYKDVQFLHLKIVCVVAVGGIINSKVESICEL